MRTLIKSATVISLVAMSAAALAQPGGPPPPPGLITYEQAETAMAAALAHARENGWDVSVRIVDQNDSVVMISRINDAAPFTVEVTRWKTNTVITTGGMTSAQYATALAAGEVEEIEDGAPFGGGVPIFIDGELVGAIAASGVQPGQDEEISIAGVEAIGGSISAD